MNYAIVGAFVIILSAALIAGALWLTSGGTFGTKYDFYLANEDESVAGLNLNAPVKYNGVDVGKVQSIKLDPVNPERVQLTFAIVRGTPIKVDTVAVLKTQGLTGIAYVELSGGARAAALLTATTEGEYPVIRTKPSLSARLENVLSTVLEKLDKTSSNIDAILNDENRQAFKSALADIAMVARTLAAKKNTIDAGINSAARTFDNSARVTAQLGPVIDRIGRGADAVEKLGNDAAAASTNASNTVTAVGADVQRFSTVTLTEVQRVLAEISVLAASLRRLSDQTQRDPGSLLRGRSPPTEGPGETTNKGRSP